MKQLVDKYAAKIVSAGLAEPGTALVGGLDAELIWSRDAAECELLARVFGGLNINSLLFAQPAEPYRTIIDFLTADGGSTIRPSDCETRTFMHDLPVIRAFDAEQIVARLRQRKSVIIPGHGIVTWGTVSPEQASIFFSSACFACFVAFFSAYLTAGRAGELSARQRAAFEKAVQHLDPFPARPPALMRGPFRTEEDVYRAVSEAGRLTVEHRLVDSFFGNVSYRFHDTLYISQTGASLDELEGCIDPCPLDGSSCAGITASSELVAHREIVERTGGRGVLHGHPKFAVILSMDCPKRNCEHLGACHIKCTEERLVGDIPIVPGEVGTGPTGLCNTLPPAIAGRRGTIVYGHGLFTLVEEDFNQAFANLLDVERMCRDTYLAEARAVSLGT